MPRHRRCRQDPDLQGPQNAITPHLEDSTPDSDDHAACRGWQDAGAISAGPRTISRTTATPDAMPRSVLPTVFDHCTPAIRGKTTTSTPPCSCIPPLLVTIKGGGGLPLRKRWEMLLDLSYRDHLRSQSPSHSQLTPTDSFSSRDLGAFLPLSPRLYPLLQALWVQDNTVPSYTPFAGRTSPRPEPG